MEIAEAARRWARTWEKHWPRGEVAPVAALYAPTAIYRAYAFREPHRGIEGVLGYLRTNFEAESELACRFSEPIVGVDRAAVEWWGSWLEDGAELTMTGVSVLRFDDAGLVLDHRDYWYTQPGRTEPYPGWVTGE